MTPNYKRHGKLMTPITDNEFTDYMKQGTFKHRKHKGFIALLYYTAVRNGEARRTIKEQLTIRNNNIIFEVGKRLKHGLHTPPLNIPLHLPFVDEIVWSANETMPGQRVWPYCRKTCYNIVHRVYAYPHFFRLNRITNFFDEGWSIAQVRTWTGLTLKALEFYVGLVDVKKMGESLR